MMHAATHRARAVINALQEGPPVLLAMRHAQPVMFEAITALALEASVPDHAAWAWLAETPLLPSNITAAQRAAIAAAVLADEGLAFELGLVRSRPFEIAAVASRVASELAVGDMSEIAALWADEATDGADTRITTAERAQLEAAAVLAPFLAAARTRRFA